MSGSTEELLAVLAAAEACLRAAVAEALPPATVLRIERNSTREARRRLADARVDRTVDLPIGWSEFVEVDEALDALLERLPPVQVVERRVVRERAAPVPYVLHTVESVETIAPPPPPADEPSWVAGLPDAGGPIEEVEEVEDEPSWAAGPAEYVPPPAIEIGVDTAPDWSAVAATPVASDDDELEATMVEPAPAPGAWDDQQQWVSYEDQPGYEPVPGFDDDEYYDTSVEPADDVQYIVYTESETEKAQQAHLDQGPLPAWADVEALPVEPEPAPARPTRGGRKKDKDVDAAPAPAREEPVDQEWAFAPKPVEPAAPEAKGDAYAVLRKERMRLDDFSQVENPAEEVTAVLPRPARSGPAAIQIAADGSGRVLGDEDEDDGTHVIELGDTRDYGDDDAIDEDQTGILGVGVVEYDEVEEIDEVEEAAPGLEDSVGAPELTPAEVSALFAKAEDVARRNMAEGTLLYGDVLDADPARIDALLARGRLYLDLGDFPGAISDFQKAETQAPRDPDVQVALGDVFQARRDYGKAVSYYNRALAIDGDHALALARRGLAHYYRRQFAGAVEDLERAKKLDPSLAHVDTYLSRARRK